MKLMGETTTKTQVRPAQNRGAPSVQWRHWPLRDRGYVALAILAMLAAAGLVVWYVTGKLHLSLLAMVLVAAGQWRQFTPITYRMDAEGVSQTILGRSQTISWPEVKQIERLDHGVLLLPRQRQHALDSYRGVYLAWNAHRDQVLACLETYIPYHLDGAGMAGETTDPSRASA